MGIRSKLIDFKNRLSDRKMYSVVLVTIAVIAGWGIYQYKHAANLRQELDNQYNRAFFEMTGYVNNVETILMKSLITNTPTKTAAILQEAWRQANMAQTNLGQLPVSQPVLANTSKFLTQVGDLAYSLNNQTMGGKQLTQDQYKTIDQLHGYSITLRDSLNDLQGQLTTGRLRWGALASKGTPMFQKTSQELPAKSFENIDKTFQEYPRLIYDGPFSDHLVTAEPRGVTGEQMDQEKAKESVVNFFGKDKIKAITNNGKNDSGPINTYSYKVTFNNVPEEQSATIDVTQKGGHVFWMLYNRPVPSSTVSIDQAKEIGRKFLEGIGYKGMKDTYYLKEDNTATINYAFNQDNVTIYSDLIKLKVALDSGEIVGFEAKGYLSAHTTRSIPKPKITEQQAKAAVSNKVKIVSLGLAIIPTDYKSELFTYEIKGRLNENDFLVYINAENGKEENILMIINTPNGILTH
ncbi:MAG: germination protein YpeB [Clostridiales bacterium]|jgi:germination protein YpeB|nr:germination protein YpeB [Clostridiales bacterium]